VIEQLRKELRDQAEKHKLEMEEKIIQSNFFNEIETKNAVERQELADKELAQQRLTIMKLTDKVKGLEKTLANSDQLVQRVRKEMESQVSANVQATMELTAKLQSEVESKELQAVELRELRQKVDLAIQEKDSSDGKLRFLQSEFSNMNKNWKLQQDEYIFQKNAAEAQLKIEMQSRLALEDENTSLALQVESLQTKVVEFENQSSLAAETFGNLEKDFSALVTAHKADLDMQLTKEYALIAHNNELSGEIASYQARLAEAEKQILDLQSHVAESTLTSESLVLLSSNLEELRTQVASLNEEKLKAVEEKLVAEVEADKLKRHNEVLQAEVSISIIS